MNGLNGILSIIGRSANENGSFLQRRYSAIRIYRRNAFIVHRPGRRARSAARQRIGHLHRFADAQLRSRRIYRNPARRFGHIYAHRRRKTVVSANRNVRISAPRAVNIAVLVDVDVPRFAGRIRESGNFIIRLRSDLRRFANADIHDIIGNGDLRRRGFHDHRALRGHAVIGGHFDLAFAFPIAAHPAVCGNIRDFGIQAPEREAPARAAVVYLRGDHHALSRADHDALRIQRYARRRRLYLNRLD